MFIALSSAACPQCAATSVWVRTTSYEVWHYSSKDQERRTNVERQGHCTSASSNFLAHTARFSFYAKRPLSDPNPRGAPLGLHASPHSSEPFCTNAYLTQYKTHHIRAHTYTHTLQTARHLRRQPEALYFHRPAASSRCEITRFALASATSSLMGRRGTQQRHGSQTQTSKIIIKAW